MSSRIDWQNGDERMAAITRNFIIEDDQIGNDGKISNIAARLLANNRNSFVDLQSQKDSKRIKPKKKAF